MSDDKCTEGRYPHQMPGAWAGTARLHWASPETMAVIGAVSRTGQMFRLGPVLVRDEADFYLRAATEAEAAAFDGMLVSHATSVEDVIEDAQPIHRAADLLADLAEDLRDNEQLRRHGPGQNG